MIKEIFIEVETENVVNNDRTFVMKSMLNSFYPVPKQAQSYSEEKLFKLYDFVNREKVLEFMSEEDTMLSRAKLLGFKLVYITKKGKFVKGEYFAHEYDQYVEGKARKIVWSHGLVEYEVKCLDKSLDVLDGMQEEYSNNGCGDTFEPSERGL